MIKTLSTAKKNYKVSVEGRCMVKLKYRDKESNIVLYVVEELNEDLIISLNDILLYFLEEFYRLLKDKRQLLIDHEIKVVDTSDLVYPWSQPFDEGPELANLEDADFCDYMNIPYQDAVKNYLLIVEDHISLEFKADQRFIQLLMSDLALAVFVNPSWTGIEIADFHLETTSDLPQHMKPAIRKVNPAIYDVAKKEFDRLCMYFYVPSESPIAVPLVIAKKATKPFVRFCGDYVPINKYIIRDNYPVPFVRDEIMKIRGFPFYIDVDLRNAFHQIRLSNKTSELLSVSTPWGQFQPKYLPEGVSAGTQKLQKTVRSIFVNDNNEHYTIQLHDNILILCNDMDDAYNKLLDFLNLANQYKVSLKMEKSQFGLREVEFFGYVCNEKEHHLTISRKQAISSIPFPTFTTPNKNTKAMQRLLGCSVYFKPFVKDYAIYAQPLYDSIKKEFDWNDINVVANLKQSFDIFKEQINLSHNMYFPDYSKQWVLQTDASISGIDGVLLQEDTDDVWVPIAFVSKAHSDKAKQWSTYQQEAHAVYHCVKELEYLLAGKDFIIETDHNNLRWMEQSLNPKIIRMYLYLRGFNFLLKHIPGTKNKLADLLSRVHEVEDVNMELCVIDSEPNLISLVHNTQEGHFGVRNTWISLNQKFPGHSISQQNIIEFISQCPTCQKNRRKGAQDQIDVLYRSLPKKHTKYVIGIDFVKIQLSKEGNIGMYVIRNLTTKHTDLYPAAGPTAENAATSIYDYITRYGLVEALSSDPGSDFTSKVVAKVNEYLGIKHMLSIVDRHESNGVERTNQEVLKHLKDYVFDTRLIDNWDNSVTISTIRYFLNYLVSTETGISPHEATFGTTSANYQKLLEIPTDFNTNNAFLSLLNDSIITATEVLSEHISKIDSHRQKRNQEQYYQFGDYVLLKLKKAPSKLLPPFAGPYKVLKHVNNEVTILHPCKTESQIVHSEDLYMFYGTTQDAIDASLRDDDQYFINKIIDYRGDPERRTELSFLIQYMDSSTSWVKYSKDINTTEAFEIFCTTYPELLTVLKKTDDSILYNRMLSSSKINPQAVNCLVHINLRSYGYDWYDGENLSPILHLVPCQLGKIIQRNYKQFIEYHIPLFSSTIRYLDAKSFHHFIYILLPSFQYIIVDEQMKIDKDWCS